MIALANRPELQASLKRLEARARNKPADVHKALRPLFVKWGTEWEREVGARFNGGGGLKSRSGALARSLKSATSGDSLDSLTLRMQSIGNLSYATKQEFGGVIRPTRSKYLTIPTRFNRTGGGEGTARFPSARALIAEQGKNTFFARSKAGNLFLWQKNPNGAVRKSAGGGKGAVPMFLLVKEVDLPGPRSQKHKGPSRLGFYDTWNAGKAKRAADLIRLGGAA